MAVKYQDHKENLFIVGHPVAHSKSPEMHNAVYAALGFPWHYDRMDCVDEAHARGFFASPNWRALNITMPYKPLALEIATEPTDYAIVAEGANVLIRVDGQFYADNTDGRGCVSYLQRCGCDFLDARVVVCGTGPTSQSILYAVAKVGAGSATLLSRTSEKATAQLEGFKDKILGSHLDTMLRAGSYETAMDAIEAADIIIDATPLGMQAGDPAPFDTRLLHAEQTVFDVVYGHATTALIEAARKTGCKAYDGSGMLVAQAVQTVYDIQDVLDVPIPFDASQLFTMMAEAAGFVECL